MRILAIVVIFVPVLALFCDGHDGKKENDMNFNDRKKFEVAAFAGGCFWCMEVPFEQATGVVKVTAGYTGGHVKDPSYEQVCSGTTGHYEAIQVLYDPDKISYEELLGIFWQQIDPTDPGGQFADQGPQYRTAIFYYNQEQRIAAEKSKALLESENIFEDPIITEIKSVSTFYPAEDYHQDYFRKCPVKYKSYRSLSGRDRFIEKIWSENKDRIKWTGDKTTSDSEYESKKELSSMQYYVTRENGTEPPFDNEYWNNKREGIYVDIITGIPLFSSRDKFNSGCGWPSFSKTLKDEVVIERIDKSQGMVRIEVRSSSSDSHLGHVFDDGPQPTGLRYCINSAALKFIAKEDLTKEGYEEYLEIFSKD